MARGRGGSHKGHRRVFTNPDELAAKQDRIDREKEWRKQRGEGDSTDEDEEEESEEETSSGDEEDQDAKAKGVEALIEISNPNRAPPKAAKKVADPKSETKPVEVQLSRREREELEKQKARETYNRLHAEGKTEQARADLARLALIRQQREEAAKKKEQERQLKEGATKAANVSKVAATKSAVTAVTASDAGDSSSGGAKKKTVKK